MDFLKEYINQIIPLCKNHKVIKLYIFGSILTNSFHKQSDVDFLVEFAEVDLRDYFDNYMELKDSLENLLHRPVDLVENQTIKNPVLRRTIDRNKQLIYG